MAEPTFDRAAFHARLATRRLGRRIVARATAGSTNDVAWDALADGSPDGTAVVADVQTAGRGRAGRAWHTAPGKGLALSVLLHPGCDLRQLPALPLVAGLAMAEALETLGLHAELKWPNDLVRGGRKLAGLLAESRPDPDGGHVVVLGAGVNVGQSREDFPPDVRALATSLALEGCATTREAVAAEFLNALEPRWTALAEGGREPLLDAWRRRASFWGRVLEVATPAGTVAGVARALDPDGGLVLERPDGTLVTVIAGDVIAAPAAAEERS